MLTSAFHMSRDPPASRRATFDDVTRLSLIRLHNMHAVNEAGTDGRCICKRETTNLKISVQESCTALRFRMRCNRSQWQTIAHFSAKLGGVRRES